MVSLRQLSLPGVVQSRVCFYVDSCRSEFHAATSQDFGFGCPVGNILLGPDLQLHELAELGMLLARCKSHHQSIEIIWNTFYSALVFWLHNSFECFQPFFALSTQSTREQETYIPLVRPWTWLWIQCPKCMARYGKYSPKRGPKKLFRSDNLFLLSVYVPFLSWSPSFRSDSPTNRSRVAMNLWRRLAQMWRWYLRSNSRKRHALLLGSNLCLNKNLSFKMGPTHLAGCFAECLVSLVDTAITVILKTKSWRRIQTFNISSLPALCARLAGFTAAKPVAHPLYSQPTSRRIAQSFCGTESTWVGPRAQIPRIRHFLRGFSGQMHPLREEKRTSREPLKQSEISWTSSCRSINFTANYIK